MTNRILAKVNDKIIMEQDLSVIINNYPEEKRKILSSEKGKKYILEQAIGNELLFCYAMDNDLKSSQEFIDKVEQYRKEILTKITLEKVLSEVKVSIEDAKIYYENNIDKFQDGEIIEARHILVETEEEALKVKKEIENGEISFEKAALKYSICPSSLQGGKLGSFGKGKMLPEFEKAAFTAEINKLTNPIKTEYGYHVILVEGKSQSSMKEFNEVKNNIIKRLTEVKEKRRYNELIDGLKDKYKVTFI